MMSGRSTVDALPWVTAGAVLAIGIASRNCVLIAMSLVFGFHAFYADMDKAAPWRGWRAATRCWLAGALGLIAALSLIVMVTAAFLDWWTPANDWPLPSLAVLMIAGATCWITAGSGPGCSQMKLILSGSMLVAVVAITARFNGFGLAPCIFAVLVSILIARIAWHLARVTAREFAMSEGSAM